MKGPKLNQQRSTLRDLCYTSIITGWAGECETERERDTDTWGERYSDRNMWSRGREIIG